MGHAVTGQPLGGARAQRLRPLVASLLSLALVATLLPLGAAAQPSEPGEADEALGDTADDSPGRGGGPPEWAEGFGRGGTARVEQSVVDEISDDGTTDFWVRLEDRADLSGAYEIDDWAERGQYVYDRLTEAAEASQRGLRTQLSARGVDHEAFWIANAVLVRDAGPGVLEAAAASQGVAEIRADHVLELPEPIEADELEAQIDSVEWGIANIRADEVWDDFGVRGEGIVVGAIDTGVQYDHPALVDQYRGNNGDGTFDHDYNWWDPTEDCGSPSTTPCDGHNHGTHVTGTMVGDDGGDNQIGVAPQAQWITASGCPSGSCSQGALLSSGQFMVAPTDVHGEDPDPAMRPHIVNNSWGGGGGLPWYDETVEAWVAAGIMPVFSNGNSGPGCGTAGSPADGPDAYAVGAYDINNDIADFSSRGPGRDGDVKPDIAAPGVNVRSAIVGDDYFAFSGTSMAGPHLAGAVALMWSAAPPLARSIDLTQELLDITAIDTVDLDCGGEPENNNVWGQGRLDAHAAVEASPRGPSGELEGTVTDAETDNPIEGATVSFDFGDFTRSTTTDETGLYRFAAVPADTQEVTAGQFGYVSATDEVDITEDEATTHDFALEQADASAVSGTITDDEGDPVLPGAVVEITDTPIAATTTDETGTYSFDAVPEGAYTLSVTPDGCLSGALVELVVADTDTTLDVELQRRQDSHGNICRPEAGGWEEADDPLPPFPDAPAFPGLLPPGPVQIDLPFAFPFYDEAHGSAYVAHSGFISFLDPALEGGNSAVPDNRLPSREKPNGAIVPFGVALNYHDGGPEVFTGTHGEEGERRFVIEWRDATVCHNDFCSSLDDGELDFQIVLHEHGEIVFQYRNIDPDSEAQRGAQSVVGIENTLGTDGLQFAFHEPLLSDEYALRFTPPPFALLSGEVTADTDQQPPASAVTVRATHGETRRETVTSDLGLYGLILDPGTWAVEFIHPRYEAKTHEVTVDDGQRATLDAQLGTAALTTAPGAVEASVVAGEEKTIEVQVQNTGSSVLDWRGVEVPGQWSHAPGEPPESGAVINHWPVEPDFFESAGRVRRANNQITAGDGTLWVTIDQPGRAVEYTLDGLPTGRQIPLWDHRDDDYWLLPTVQPAFLPEQGWLCMHGAEGGQTEERVLACVDPDEGEVIDHLELEGSPTPQAIAYDPVEDVFYLGEQGTQNRHQVAGFSHSSPGTVLSSCVLDLPEGSAPNPTYHQATNTLWFTIRGQTDLLRVDADDCTVLDSLGTEITLPDDPEGFGEWVLRGAAVAENGDLFVVASALLDHGGEGRVYQVASGSPEAAQVPWLGVQPASGAVAPGDSQTVEVTVDATNLEQQPGIHTAELVLSGNVAQDQGRPSIPVELEVLPDGEVPPAVWDSLEGERTFELGEGWVYVGGPDKEVTVELSARPSYQGAEVEVIEYRLGDGDWTVYDGPFAVSEPADHTVTYRATDADGNTSEERTVEFTIAAGRVAADADSLDVTVTAGETTSESLTVTNVGSRPADAGLFKGGDPVGAPGGASAPDVSEGVWVELPELPNPAGRLSAVTVDGSLYVFEGDDVYRLDLDNLAQGWQQQGEIPDARPSMVAEVIDGKVYMTGGWAVSLLVYDPQADSWSTGADMPAAPQNSAASAVVDGRLYVVGGGIGSGSTDVYRYDPAADEWETLADYPESIQSTSCGGIDGQLYCAGGETTGGHDGSSDRTYAYDPAADSWEAKADLPMPLRRSASAVGNGQLIVAGGLPTGSILDAVDDAYAYEPTADEWSQLPDMNYAKSRAAGACGMFRVGGVRPVAGAPASSTVEVLPGLQDCGDQGPEPAPWLRLGRASAALEPGESVEVDVEFSAEGIDEPGVYEATLTPLDSGPFGHQEPISVTMEVVEAEPGPPGQPGPPPWMPGPPPWAPGGPGTPGPPGHAGPR